ncbi:unnamed protein product [Protopolystoma xenopodis]|uniref:Uncharacterized protein n=1 Tax=Protopolystoma xenopodis TaxID=117903 RepID=A0A448WZ33_9PLAT|nr:unnamed protein product [Protopolystoma xenopodis]
MPVPTSPTMPKSCLKVAPCEPSEVISSNPHAKLARVRISNCEQTIPDVPYDFCEKDVLHDFLVDSIIKEFKLQTLREKSNSMNKITRRKLLKANTDIDSFILDNPRAVRSSYESCRKNIQKHSGHNHYLLDNEVHSGFKRQNPNRHDAAYLLLDLSPIRHRSPELNNATKRAYDNKVAHVSPGPGCLRPIKSCNLYDSTPYDLKYPHVSSYLSSSGQIRRRRHSYARTSHHLASNSNLDTTNKKKISKRLKDYGEHYPISDSEISVNHQSKGPCTSCYEDRYSSKYAEETSKSRMGATHKKSFTDCEPKNRFRDHIQEPLPKNANSMHNRTNDQRNCIGPKASGFESKRNSWFVGLVRRYAFFLP